MCIMFIYLLCDPWGSKVLLPLERDEDLVPHLIYNILDVAKDSQIQNSVAKQPL